MFALGYIHFKKYTVWVSAPVFDSNYRQGADKLPYYEVLVSRKEIPELNSTIKEKDLYNISVNIASAPEFKFLLNLNERNQPIEELTDMIQYQSYLDRKDNSNTLCKLSKENVELLLQKCHELSI